LGSRSRSRQQQAHDRKRPASPHALIRKLRMDGDSGHYLVIVLDLHISD
jgi:hypothetical protein